MATFLKNGSPVWVIFLLLMDSTFMELVLERKIKTMEPCMGNISTLDGLYLYGTCLRKKDKNYGALYG